MERRHEISFRVLRRRRLPEKIMAIKFHFRETFKLFCLSQDGTETPQGVIERPVVELPEQLLNLADFASPSAARARAAALLQSLVLEAGASLDGSLVDALAEAMHAEALEDALVGGGVALEVRLEISTEVVEERAACTACRGEYAAGEAAARARFALCGHSYHAECLRYCTERGGCPSSMCPACLYGHK